MLTALTKNGNKQVGATVDDFSVRGEIWISIDHTKHLHDTPHPIKVSQRFLDERKEIQANFLSVHPGLLDSDFLPNFRDNPPPSRNGAPLPDR
ncbi:hypothetical protein SAMN04487951_1093 [Vreelandella arcis]|uniref:Uncharacterized protein n=1 Tax=Vreelandella arcis TaxID=416873 RepID=A0A1H0EU25_9GAMM|nr:hypothetical protein SAMN04487951_1093 [Halomonas arcis]